MNYSKIIFSDNKTILRKPQSLLKLRQPPMNSYGYLSTLGSFLYSEEVPLKLLYTQRKRYHETRPTKNGYFP